MLIIFNTEWSSYHEVQYLPESVAYMRTLQRAYNYSYMHVQAILYNNYYNREGVYILSTSVLSIIYSHYIVSIIYPWYKYKYMLPQP